MPVRHRETGSSSSKGNSSSNTKTPFSGRFNPRIHKTDTKLTHQTLTKIVTIVAVVVVGYFASSKKGGSETPLAKSDEIIEQKRFQNSLCAPSFKKEIEDLGNKACLPARCGGVVLDGLVSDLESHGLLKLAKKGLAKGGSSGGASILDLHSGALSSGQHFVNIYKTHPDLFDAKDFDVYSSVKDRIRRNLAEHFQVEESSLFLTHPTFFSRLESRPAESLHDEYWHVHVDKETYPSFHYTSLLYLTDHNEDFQGGEFVFVDNHDKLNRTIEPRVGRVSMFTSGIENKHHVKPVKSGARYALTMGFTCDKSKAIPDPGSEEHSKTVKQ